MALEKRFTCPYCREKITMVLEDTGEAQTYIEDCEVCCNPIQITFDIEFDEVKNFTAVRAQ